MFVLFVYRMAAFQNVSCFVFEQSKVFHNATVQNTVYNVYCFKTPSMSISNAVKKQSGIEFAVDNFVGTTKSIAGILFYF